MPPAHAVPGNSPDLPNIPNIPTSPDKLHGPNALPFWLHSRHVLLACAAVALALLLVAIGLVSYERRALEDSTMARGALYARVLEDQANRSFNGVELALTAAAEIVRSQDDVARSSPALQQSLQALPFLRSISLVDGRGQVLASSAAGNVGRLVQRQRLLPGGQAAGLGALLPGRDLVDLAGAGPATDAAKPAGARSGAQMLALVRPLGSTPGADWLVATINPDYFANQHALLLADTPLRAALLSYSGQLLVADADSRRLAGEQFAKHPVFAEELPAGREHGQLLVPSIDGDLAYTAYRTVNRQPLVLLVETPEATVRVQIQRLARRVALGMATLLLLIGALGFGAWRSLRSHEAVRGDLAAARGSMAVQHAFTDRLFQVSPIPMVVKDADGRFLRINKAWTDFTGITPERLVGNNMGRLYPAHLAAPHEVQEQMAIASGQPTTYEEQLLDSDGLPREVMIRLVPYADVMGQVAGVIVCLMDVTEFREAARRTLEAKEAAERANAAKSEFLANISHELRTPLQSILGFSELGSLRAADQPRLAGMFSEIHGAGQRMLALVNNLLDLSRLESTVGEIQLQPLNIVPALRAVVDELRQLACARQLRLVVPAVDAGVEAGVDAVVAGAAAAPALWARADAFRLQQVLRNLLANAIRFAPEGSSIAVDWRQLDSQTLRLSVRDQGPGIPEDELDSIFEAFVQSSRTKDGAGGTGLGLAICRKIITGHQGHIRAYNHPQGGAVFVVHLPAVAPPGAQALGAPPATAVPARATL